MLKDNIQKALNNQLNAEFYSSYLYLSMAAYFESENLIGFAHWMKLQSQEEYGHAMRIYDYIHQRDGRVQLVKIEGPGESWKTLIELFEEVLAHEKKISQSINDIVELTLKEKDYATNNFLQWFISEQVEEEATSQFILDRAKLVGENNRNGIFLLDGEMAQRVTAEAGGEVSPWRDGRWLAAAKLHSEAGKMFSWRRIVILRFLESIHP